LYSNLLEVTRFGEHIYVAETDFRDPGSLWTRLYQQRSHVGNEWVLKNRRIFSFHDLSTHPWNQICDQGTVEQFDVEEWALSEDPDVQRDFVRLLNLSLKEKLNPDVLYQRKRGCYYFAPTADLSSFTLPYKSRVQNTARTVFQGYPFKKDPSRIAYYRHSAFVGQFMQADGT
jgi:hypothetical protein